MIAMQNTSLDMLMYYDAKSNSAYCGLYDPLNDELPVAKEKRVFKAYYSFQAFNGLYRLGEQLYADSDDCNVYVLAATNGAERVAIVTNDSGEEKESVLHGVSRIIEARLISDESDYGVTNLDSAEFVLKPYETVAIKFI